MSSAPDSSPPPLPGCPYPGLRPFRRDEDNIFFGRSTHVSHLLGHLGDHRFLAVLGASGSGKSSLVRAGLMPALEAGLAGEIGYEWCCAEFRPGDDPLQRLADVLAELDNSLDDPAHAQDGHARLLDADREFHRTHLTRRQNPLEEFRNDSRLAPDVNLLLLVDQFEELFRFRDPLQAEEEEANAAPSADGRPRLTRQERVDESEVFINLLLAALSHPRIYIVLTMRSEYLGDCAKFGGLTEAINQNHYLTPRLNREQMAEAIERPASQRGVSVEPELLNRLLNDAGANSDQLPLLQHTLARMWRRLPGGAATLTLAQYLDKPIETIARCLDAHATAIYESLNTEQQRIAARLFRSLTERGRHRRDTRRICTLGEIVDLIAADRARSAAAPDTPSTHAQLPSAPAPSRDEMRPEVLAVIEKYREAEAAMLMPEAGVPLSDESTLDITHESVIRQWSLLRTQWIAREAEAAEGYFEYSSQARKRMLAADAAQRTRKRFFLSWFSRIALQQPSFIVGAKLRRQLQLAATTAREFTDHLDDFGLQTAIRWRDAGGTTQTFLENASWKEAPPAADKAAAPLDDMSRSAVWALRYDKLAAQHFPLTLNYINESQIRRESERAERWMLLNIVKVLSFLTILGVIGVCWVLHSLSKATEANLAAKTDADRRVDQALAEKRAADARVAEALAEKAAAATAATQAKALTQTAQTDTKAAEAKAATAALEQQKAGAAIMEARTQQAVSDWGAGRMLNALSHLARTQPPGSNAPWPPALASELPPPVTFSHLITNSAPPHSMTLSPDGRWLAVRTEKGVDLVDTHTGQLAGPPLERDKSYYDRESLCFVPAGNPGEWLLLHLSFGRLELYRIPALTPLAGEEPAWIATLAAQGQSPWEVIALSGDGSRLAALGGGGAIALVSLSAPHAGFLWQLPRDANAKPSDASGGELIALDHQGRHLAVVTAVGEVLVAEAGASAAQCRLLAMPYTPDRAAGLGNVVQLAVSPLTSPVNPGASRLRLTLADGEGRILPLSLERAAAGKQKAGAAAEREFQLVVETPPEGPPQTALNLAVQAGPGTAPALAGNAPRPTSQYANQTGHRDRRTSAPPGMQFPRRGLPLIWTGNDATLRCWWGHGWRAAEEQWPNFQLVEAHRGKVTGCAIAPDASWAATCGEDGVTRFWHLMSGAERRQRVALQPAEWSTVRWRGDVPVAWGLDAGGLLKTFVAGGGFKSHPLRTFVNLVDEPEINHISGDGSTALVLSLEGLQRTGIADLAHPLRKLPLDRGEASSQLSHSGRRVATLSPAGQLAVYDATSGARVPGFAAPEGTVIARYWYGAEDCLAAITEDDALLLLHENAAPVILMPAGERGGKRFTVAAPAGGQHLLVVLALEESNRAAVHRYERKAGAWPRDAAEPVPIDFQMGYDGGDFACSPDGEWIAWVDPEQRLRRLQWSLRREFPVTQPFPGKPASFAIRNGGELLAAAGRELHRWAVPAEEQNPVPATAATPVPLEPECDWRLAVFKDSAESTTGLHQESTFVQAPDIAVPGTTAPLPSSGPGAPALWQAVIQSDRALADLLLAAKQTPVSAASLAGNSDFPALLRWLDAAAQDPAAAPLLPSALSSWNYLTELAGLPKASLSDMATETGSTAGLLSLARMELPLLRGQRALESNATVGFGFALLKQPEAQKHLTDADLLDLLKAAVCGETLAKSPLLLPHEAEPIFTALLPWLSGTGESWQEPFLAALQHHPAPPHPERSGPPLPPERWREAAAAAAEAARRMQKVPALEQSHLLQPVTLLAGRLARLAGQADADEFLKASAESPPLSAGHAEMKALALALLGDCDGAIALLQPLLPAEDQPGRSRRHAYAPEFLATVQLLQARQLSRAGDAVKAAELKSLALDALRQSSAANREQFLGFFRATPEIWEHAREFRAPQSARPPGRMRR